MRLVFTLIFMVLAFSAGAQQRRGDGGGDFDHYVLSVSWSPTFCLNRQKRAENLGQCSLRQHLWSVHGLWPSKAQGWNQYCDSTETFSAQSRPMQQVARIMPNMSFAKYQWYKHGTCSALSQDAYFEQMIQAFDMFKFPELDTGNAAIGQKALGELFMKNNPGLNPSNFVLRCRKNLLQEINICLSKSLQPVSCTGATTTCPDHVAIPLMTR